MSAQRAHAPPSTRSSSTITDADVLELVPIRGPGSRAAERLLLWLKKTGGGRRFAVASNARVCDELGISPATLKRAKRVLRNAGLQVTELRDRNGDFDGAARYVLDRRWIKTLRAADDGQSRPGVRSDVTGSKETKTLRVITTATPCSDSPKVTAPRGSPTTAEAVVEPPAMNGERELEAVSRAAAVAAVPDALEALAVMRAGLPANVDELAPEELDERLRMLQRRATTAGLDRYAAIMARGHLFAELRSGEAPDDMHELGEVG